MTSRWFAWVGLTIVSLSRVTTAAEPIALLELKIGTERLEGRIAAHNDETCWLLGRDGHLQSFRTDDVTDFHEIETKFRPYSSLDLRDRLLKELGRGFEVKMTQHYVVAGPPGMADRYARLFESIYRQFHTYFTTRGFRITEPEFPMIAVVMPDEQSFMDYCVALGTRPQQGLVGFYLPGSNRVVLYDRTTNGVTSMEAVDDTVIHEGTHQIAFNTGVHSRIGPSPQWLVEGLATLFEAEGIRKREIGSNARDRVNEQRLDWFQDYRQKRPAKSLEAFLRDDTMFRKATLDAYSQAWALTFYLAESRQVEFAKYLKTIASRNPLLPYDGDARVKDFRDTFGKDLDFLETGMLRYFDRLEN